MADKVNTNFTGAAAYALPINGLEKNLEIPIIF